MTMYNNLILMVDIHDETKTVKSSEYSSYSIDSWKRYCAKHGIDFFVITKDRTGLSEPIFNKEMVYVFDKHDKFGLVDADTIVLPDAPNIFDRIETGMYGVNDLGNLTWILNSIRDRQFLFPDVQMDLTRYINAGVLFFDKTQLPFFKTTLELVRQNYDQISKIKGGGKEQTILNFVLQRDNADIKLLPFGWNMFNIHKNNLWKHNWQLETDQRPYFEKYGYVLHFTGMPIEQRVSTMKTVYERYYSNN